MSSIGSSADFETISYMGYGAPTYGLYNSTIGGWKSFGTVGQGNSSVGVKNDYDQSISERIVIVSVSALLKW